MLANNFPDQFIKETLQKSPIRRLRYDHSPPLSQLEASVECNMGINTYYLYEIGVYATPSDSIVNGLINEPTLIPFLYSDYKKYQTYKRRLFVEKVGSEFIIEALELAKAGSRVSPIESLISSMGCSNIAFCKILCINPGHLSKLRAGTLGKLPAALENALVDIGLEFADIDEINERLKEFCHS